MTPDSRNSRIVANKALALGRDRCSDVTAGGKTWNKENETYRTVLWRMLTWELLRILSHWALGPIQTLVHYTFMNMHIGFARLLRKGWGNKWLDSTCDRPFTDVCVRSHKCHSEPWVGGTVWESADSPLIRITLIGLFLTAVRFNSFWGVCIC